MLLSVPSKNPDPDEHGVLHPSTGTNLPSFLANRFDFYINYDLSRNSRTTYVSSFMNAFLEAARDLRSCSELSNRFAPHRLSLEKHHGRKKKTELAHHF
jgi:hypothetical protein